MEITSKVEKSQVNLIMGFDKNAVAFCRGQIQFFGNALDEILDPGVRRDLKYLKTGRENHQWITGPHVLLLEGDLACFWSCLYSYLVRVIGELHFVEDLSAVLLDGLHLHLMWWQLPGLNPTQRHQTLISSVWVTHLGFKRKDEQCAPGGCRHCECKSNVFIVEAMQMQIVKVMHACFRVHWISDCSLSKVSQKSIHLHLVTHERCRPQLDISSSNYTTCGVTQLKCCSCTFLKSNMRSSLLTHSPRQTACFWNTVTRKAAHWSDLSELCSRCRQSEARGSLRRDSTKRWVCFRRDWLGGNRPQQSHSSCQPCSMLNLGDEATHNALVETFG